MEKIKEMYETPEDWAGKTVELYFNNLQKEETPVVNENFIKDLILCSSWEDVEDIIKRYPFTK